MAHIAFMWRKNSRNIGDRFSGWPLYGTFPEHAQIDLDYFERNECSLVGYSHVIIGGGLYPDPKWFPHTRKEIERCGARVLGVGVGRNEDFKLADNETVFWRHGSSDELAPCPSALNIRRLLPEIPQPTCPLVVYHNPQVAKIEMNAPTRINLGYSMEEALKFLAAGRRVITSSYHGAYWATLMGREVMVVSDRGKMDNPCWGLPKWNLKMAEELVLHWIEVIKAEIK